MPPQPVPFWKWFRPFQGNDAPTHPSSCTDRYSYQFENNHFTEMCSGFEAGSYLRLIDFVYHSTLGLRVIKKKKKKSILRHPQNLEGEILGVFQPPESKLQTLNPIP